MKSGPGYTMTVQDKMFCYMCVQALKQRSTMLMGRKEDAFLTVHYTNWKDATGGQWRVLNTSILK